MVIFALVLVGYASAAIDGPERSLMSRRRREAPVSADCSAASKLKIRVLAGSCSGVAEADCSAYAEARSEVNRDIREWFATKECQKGDLTAYAKAHAKAVAKVLAVAYVKVQCSGVGFACGTAVAKGSALAKGFAKAQAIAFTDADPSAEHAGTFCESDVEALGDVYAEAFEKARAKACANSWESAGQLEIQFTEAIECAIVSAYARAEAEYCTKKGWGDYAKERASSRCTGRGDSLKVCPGYE